LGEDETALRRAILQAKRDIHNQAPCKLGVDVLDQIESRLDDPMKQAFRVWRETEAALRVTIDEAERVFAAELQTKLRAGLRMSLQDPLFRNALSLASPGVARHALREKDWPTKPEPDNFERSLLGYLMRAAAKTSPFSSFMATTAVELDLAAGADRPKLEPGHAGCVTRLNRGVVARLLRAVLRQAARDDAVPLRVNPTLQKIGPQRFRALCGRDVVLLGRPWREQRRAQFQLHAKLGEVLLGAPADDRWSGWLRRFQAAGIAADQTESLLGKLVDRDLLTLPAQLDAFCADPEAELLRVAATVATPRLEPALAPLRELVGIAAGLSGGEQRDPERGAGQIREAEAASMSLLEAESAEFFQNIILEDCWTGGVSGRLGGELLAPLADLQDFLSTQIEMSPHYCRLRQQFVERFGIGGRCDDVVDFLVHAGDRLVDVTEYGSRIREDEAALPPAGAAIAVTAQLQIAVDPSGRRPPLAIVNKVFDRPAWLAARFASMQSHEEDRNFLREALSDWLDRIAAPAEPVDLPINGGCNDLQTHPRLTRRVLAWPGEPLAIPEGDRIHPEELRLVDNPETGLLDLFDGGRRPISLLYLGSTFPTTSWGIPYALSILTQPLRLIRPSFPPPRTDGEFVFVPRITRGRVILRRAVWWVRTDYLKCAWFAQIGPARLRNVHRECRRHGLPETFFAQRITRDRDDGNTITADALDGSRKPLWVDTRNPFCLSLLQRLTEKSPWISLTEPLPSHNENWLEVGGQSHVCELQVELRVREARQSPQDA
jgi:hypothetical protein